MSEPILPSRPLELADLEDETERRYRKVLQLASPLSPLMRLAVHHVAEPWLSTKKTAAAIRVGPSQMPELHALILEVSDLLGVVPPQVFVTRSASIGSLLLGTEPRYVLILYSALLDVYQPEHLRFHLGRKLASIRQGNVALLTLNHWIQDQLTPTLKKLLKPYFVALSSWQRAVVFSGDRSGLLVQPDLECVQEALLLQNLGSRELVRAVDVPRFIRRSLRDTLEQPVRSLPALSQTAPSLPRRLARLYRFYGSERFQELYPHTIGLTGQSEPLEE